MNDNFEYLNNFSGKSIIKLGIDKVTDFSNRTENAKKNLKLLFNSTKATEWKGKKKR